MKKLSEDKVNQSCKIGKGGLLDSFSRRIEKLKNGTYKCLFCSETFKGLKAMLSHLKDHCT